MHLGRWRPDALFQCPCNRILIIITVHLLSSLELSIFHLVPLCCCILDHIRSHHWRRNSLDIRGIQDRIRLRKWSHECGTFCQKNHHQDCVHSLDTANPVHKFGQWANAMGKFNGQWTNVCNWQWPTILVSSFSLSLLYNISVVDQAKILTGAWFQAKKTHYKYGTFKFGTPYLWNEARYGLGDCRNGSTRISRLSIFKFSEALGYAFAEIFAFKDLRSNFITPYFERL